MINRLTGTQDRMPGPVLTTYDRSVIAEITRELTDVCVRYEGRQYWADPNGAVYVVAFDSGEAVSGDLVIPAP